MASYRLKRKTFSKFEDYIKKNNIKVEDAKIVEEGFTDKAKAAWNGLSKKKKAALIATTAAATATPVIIKVVRKNRKDKKEKK